MSSAQRILGYLSSNPSLAQASDWRAMLKPNRWNQTSSWLNLCRHQSRSCSKTELCLTFLQIFFFIKPPLDCTAEAKCRISIKSAISLIFELAFSCRNILFWCSLSFSFLMLLWNTYVHISCDDMMDKHGPLKFLE